MTDYDSTDYEMGVNHQGINANDKQLQLDREYFQLNPKRSHYIRERLPTELDINAPYVLVIKVGEGERTRFPSERMVVSRQKIKKLKKFSIKQLKNLPKYSD